MVRKNIYLPISIQINLKKIQHYQSDIVVNLFSFLYEKGYIPAAIFTEMQPYIFL